MEFHKLKNVTGGNEGVAIHVSKLIVSAAAIDDVLDAAMAENVSKRIVARILVFFFVFLDLALQRYKIGYGYVDAEFANEPGTLSVDERISGDAVGATPTLPYV